MFVGDSPWSGATPPTPTLMCDPTFSAVTVLGIRTPIWKPREYTTLLKLCTVYNSDFIGRARQSRFHDHEAATPLIFAISARRQRLSRCLVFIYHVWFPVMFPVKAECACTRCLDRSRRPMAQSFHHTPHTTFHGPYKFLLHDSSQS